MQDFSPLYPTSATAIAFLAARSRQLALMFVIFQQALFSMDSGLRSLPIAALHDGQQFLVEKYSLGLIPSISLTNTRYRSLQNTQVLAMGASEFPEAPPLPAVPTELATITEELWQGEAFLNQDFTRENLLSEREQHGYEILHLATHGEFQAGAPKYSYIHFGDRK